MLFLNITCTFVCICEYLDINPKYYIITIFTTRNDRKTGMSVTLVNILNGNCKIVDCQLFYLC